MLVDMKCDTLSGNQKKECMAKAKEQAAGESKADSV